MSLHAIVAAAQALVASVQNNTWDAFRAAVDSARHEHIDCEHTSALRDVAVSLVDAATDEDATWATLASGIPAVQAALLPFAREAVSEAEQRDAVHAGPAEPAGEVQTVAGTDPAPAEAPLPSGAPTFEDDNRVVHEEPVAEAERPAVETAA